MRWLFKQHSQVGSMMTCMLSEEVLTWAALQEIQSRMPCSQLGEHQLPKGEGSWSSAGAHH